MCLFHGFCYVNLLFKSRTYGISCRNWGCFLCEFSIEFCLQRRLNIDWSIKCTNWIVNGKLLIKSGKMKLYQIRLFVFSCCRLPFHIYFTACCCCCAFVYFHLPRQRKTNMMSLSNTINLISLLLYIMIITVYYYCCCF